MNCPECKAKDSIHVLIEKEGRESVPLTNETYDDGYYEGHAYYGDIYAEVEVVKVYCTECGHTIEIKDIEDDINKSLFIIREDES